MSALPPKADIAGRHLDVRLVPKADIRTLATSAVRSNRGSIEVGDLEESEPQADFAGELIFEWFKLEFSIREGTCGGVGVATLFVSRGRIADRDRGRCSCRALDFSVNATAPDRRGAEDAQLDP